MNYYNGLYGVPMGYQQSVMPMQYGSYVTPSTTAQQMMQQPVVQQPVVQQPVVQQPVVQQPVVNSQFTGVIVNTFDDVRDYPVPIGGLTLLLNKKERKFYIKSLNDSGVPIIESYKFDSISSNTNDISDIKQTDNNDNINNLEKRLSIIESKLKIE